MGPGSFESFPEPMSSEDPNKGLGWMPGKGEEPQPSVKSGVE